MKATKTILTFAVISALPMVVYADYVYNEINRPVPVSYNGGTVTIPEEAPPYETLEVTNDDASHIASTAYVKGAYNEAIAAVNMSDKLIREDVDLMFETLQPKLLHTVSGVGHPIEIEVQGWLWNNDYPTVDPDVTLVNMTAVRNAITDVNTTISNKRVEIYTTWDNDNAKTEVPFVTASGQQ